MSSGYYLLDYPNPNTPQCGYPRRGAEPSGTIIVHTSESVLDQIGPDSTAEDCAAFIGRRTDYGSYHRLVDSDSIVKMAPFDYETWQDSETNPWGIGISAAVQADQWATYPAKQRDRIYRNLAAVAAEAVLYMRGRGISVPLRRITGAEARARVPGFCAHGDSGIDRHDPGSGFDWALFFRYTAEALNTTVPASAGTANGLEELADMEPDVFKALVVQAMRDAQVTPRWVNREREIIWNGPISGNSSAKNELVLTHQGVVKLQATLDAQQELLRQLAGKDGVEIDYARIQTIVNDSVANAVIDVDVNVNGQPAGGAEAGQ